MFIQTKTSLEGGLPVERVRTGGSRCTEHGRTGTAQAPFCLSRAVSLGPYFPGGENLRPGEGEGPWGFEGGAAPS